MRTRAEALAPQPGAKRGFVFQIWPIDQKEIWLGRNVKAKVASSALWRCSRSLVVASPICKYVRDFFRMHPRVDHERCPVGIVSTWFLVFVCGAVSRI